MNLVFRAYYALIGRPLRTTDGRNTSAVFGFARMLLKALADYRPTHVAVALEGGGPTFREEIYPEYKATRKAPPDDLVAQIEPVKEFARLLGLAVVEKEGIEADDVVATLARGGAGRFGGAGAAFRVTARAGYGLRVTRRLRGRIKTEANVNGAGPLGRGLCGLRLSGIIFQL